MFERYIEMFRPATQCSIHMCELNMFKLRRAVTHPFGNRRSLITISNIVKIVVSPRINVFDKLGASLLFRRSYLQEPYTVFGLLETKRKLGIVSPQIVFDGGPLNLYFMTSFTSGWGIKSGKYYTSNQHIKDQIGVTKNQWQHGTAVIRDVAQSVL